MQSGGAFEFIRTISHKQFLVRCEFSRECSKNNEPNSIVNDMTSYQCQQQQTKVEAHSTNTVEAWRIEQMSSSSHS